MENLMGPPFGHPAKTRLDKRQFKRAVSKHPGNVETDMHSQREHSFQKTDILVVSEDRETHDAGMTVGASNIGESFVWVIYMV